MRLRAKIEYLIITKGINLMGSGKLGRSDNIKYEMSTSRDLIIYTYLFINVSVTQKKIILIVLHFQNLKQFKGVFFFFSFSVHCNQALAVLIPIHLTMQFSDSSESKK